jgi:ankyrin repeat protein
VATNGTMHGATALGCAANTANKTGKALRLLLKAGADIDQQNMFGSTALIRTARRGNQYATRILLELGARTDLKTWKLRNCKDMDCMHAADALGWLKLIDHTPERLACGKLIRSEIRERIARGTMPEQRMRVQPLGTHAASLFADSTDRILLGLALMLSVLLALLLCAKRRLRAESVGASHGHSMQKRAVTPANKRK